jgi:AraC-like DNA-binding protein
MIVGLERTSPAQGPAQVSAASRLRHPPRQHMPRHPHDHGFAAVVLTGGYVEAGDTGQHRMEAGDVLFHQAWESHLDRFDGRGAEVLVLPIADRDAGALTGRIADPDAIARLAERSPEGAAQRLLADLLPKAPAAADWPELLAQAMRADPSLSLGAWASQWGLHVGSLSRGFRQVFGMTPVGYRLTQRTRRAIEAVLHSQTPLSLIAQDCGFADQAHMSRAIGRLARTTPAALRRRQVVAAL